MKKTNPKPPGRKKKFEGETTLVSFRVPLATKEDIKLAVYKIINKYAVTRIIQKK